MRVSRSDPDLRVGTPTPLKSDGTETFGPEVLQRSEGVFLAD
jgi:hypothetical protein